MRGIWLEEGAVSLRDGLPVPTPGPAEALVRAGICNTDLELVGGYYPYTGILGHEFAGVVEQGPDDLRGQRVVGEINATCGKWPAFRGRAPQNRRPRPRVGRPPPHIQTEPMLRCPDVYKRQGQGRRHRRYFERARNAHNLHRDPGIGQLGFGGTQHRVDVARVIARGDDGHPSSGCSLGFCL